MSDDRTDSNAAEAADTRTPPLAAHLHFEQVEALFRRALEVAPADRAALLDDPAIAGPVRDEVVELLDEDARTGSPLDGAPADAAIAGALVSHPAGTQMPRDESPRLTIPGYVIGREVGRGGMGVVYEAEQDEPRRSVAIKLLAGAVPGPAALARFRRESRALGRLDHPAIAGIHRAGAVETAAGHVPWFAMDLINGRAIDATTFPDPRVRLERLAEIADAVQHAHSRGVIHRDLKPGNILIDERGHPRIVDFGVARLSHDGRDDPSLVTRHGQLIGTPAYMAPEQASGDPDAVDARADVYALGAVAYEVLSGVRPLDAGSLSIEQQLRMVREADPRPLTSVAPRLPRDASVVVARAMAKEPSRRYPTAAALADDLRRVRDGLPVTARPASSIYQLRRLASRHRAVATVTAASLLLLVGSLVAISILLANSRTAEAEATAARDRADEQRAIAERQSDISDGVRSFLVEDVLAETGPLNTDRDVRAIDELLARAAASIDTRFADRPAVAAEVYATLGAIEHARMNHRVALNHFDRYDAIREASADGTDGLTDPLAPGPGGERALRHRLAQARAMADSGRADEIADDIAALHRTAIERFGPDDAISIQIALTRSWVDRSRLDYGGAIERLTDLRTRTLAARGPNDAFTRQATSDLAQMLHLAGRFAEAEPLLIETVEFTRQREGPDAWNTITGLISLGQLHSDLGHDDAAMERFKEAQAAFRLRGTPPGNEKETTLLSNMGLNRLYVGALDEAERWLNAGLENARIGDHDDGLAASSLRQNLAGLHLTREAYPEAVALLERSRVDLERIVPPGDPELMMNVGLLGRVHLMAADPAAAREPLETAWSGFAELFGPESQYAMRTAQDLVRVHQALQDDDAVAIWLPRSRPPSDETVD